MHLETKRASISLNWVDALESPLQIATTAKPAALLRF